MKRYVDLSGKVENGLWGYEVLPGLEKIIPPARVETIATVRENGFFGSRISLSTITGTYLEAGSHILEKAKNLDAYSVSDFIKPAAIVRLPRQKEKALVQGELLEKHAPRVSRGDALIIDTGWGAMWNRPGYVLTCPNLARSALEWALAKGISIFGTDVPCIESSWSEDEASEKGGLLGKLFERNVLLVAPLVNLDQAKADRGMLYCLPLSVAGTSGAPARVVWEEESLPLQQQP
jgi:kynurenine formamidase